MKTRPILSAMPMALIQYLSVLTLAACGGGSGHSQGDEQKLSSTSLANSVLSGGPRVPPLIGTGQSGAAEKLLRQKTECPRLSNKISISASTLKNVVLTLGATGQEQLVIRTGTGEPTDLEACLVYPLEPGYTLPPPEVGLLLADTGAQIHTHLIINGDISTFREIRLVLLKTLDTVLRADEANRFSIVAYTQDGESRWERTVLQTTSEVMTGQTQQSGTALKLSAVVMHAGYYTIEKDQ